MTNLTRQEIIDFATRLVGVEAVTEQIHGHGECLVVRSDRHGALYTSTSDAEAYAWLCGYAYGPSPEHPEVVKHRFDMAVADRPLSYA